MMNASRHPLVGAASSPARGLSGGPVRFSADLSGSLGSGASTIDGNRASQESQLSADALRSAMEMETAVDRAVGGGGRGLGAHAGLGGAFLGRHSGSLSLPDWESAEGRPPRHRPRPRGLREDDPLRPAGREGRNESRAARSFASPPPRGPAGDPAERMPRRTAERRAGPRSSARSPVATGPLDEEMAAADLRELLQMMQADDSAEAAPPAASPAPRGPAFRTHGAEAPRTPPEHLYSVEKVPRPSQRFYKEDADFFNERIARFSGAPPPSPPRQTSPPRRSKDPLAQKSSGAVSFDAATLRRGAVAPLSPGAAPGSPGAKPGTSARPPAKVFGVPVIPTLPPPKRDFPRSLMPRSAAPPPPAVDSPERWTGAPRGGAGAGAALPGRGGPPTGGAGSAAEGVSSPLPYSPNPRSPARNPRSPSLDPASPGSAPDPPVTPNRTPTRNAAPPPGISPSSRAT